MYLPAEPISKFETDPEDLRKLPLRSRIPSTDVRFTDNHQEQRNSKQETYIQLSTCIAKGGKEAKHCLRPMQEERMTQLLPRGGGMRLSQTGAKEKE